MRCDSMDHPLANREFLFPYCSVVEMPQAEMIERDRPLAGGDGADRRRGMDAAAAGGAAHRPAEHRPGADLAASTGASRTRATSSSFSTSAVRSASRRHDCALELDHRRSCSLLPMTVGAGAPEFVRRSRMPPGPVCISAGARSESAGELAREMGAARPRGDRPGNRSGRPPGTRSWAASRRPGSSRRCLITSSKIPRPKPSTPASQRRERRRSRPHRSRRRQQHGHREGMQLPPHQRRADAGLLGDRQGDASRCCR